MRRVVADAASAGLDGVLVTPGPDLVWLTGYQPTAITERLTVLVLAPDREPTLLVPTLERPDAEARRGAADHAIVDWPDGADPYAAASALLRPDGALRDLRLRVGDAPAGTPGRAARIRVRLADAEPADAARGQGRQRARPARGGRRGRGRDVRARSSRCGSPAGRRPTWPPTSPRLLREFGHEQVDFTVVGSGTQRRQPAPRGRRPDHRGRRRGRARLRRADVRLRLGHQPHRLRRRAVRTRSARCTRSSAWRSRPASTRSGPGVACQEIDRAARAGDHGRRVRRAVHPPHRPRHRHHHARAAVHDRGRGAAAGARDVLLGGARHLPRRPVRRPDRGHRHRHRDRRPRGSTTPSATSRSSSRPRCAAASEDGVRASGLTPRG